MRCDLCRIRTGNSHAQAGGNNISHPKRSQDLTRTARKRWQFNPWMIVSVSRPGRGVVHVFVFYNRLVGVLSQSVRREDVQHWVRKQSENRDVGFYQSPPLQSGGKPIYSLHSVVNRERKMHCDQTVRDHENNLQGMNAQVV